MPNTSCPWAWPQISDIGVKTKPSTSLAAKGARLWDLDDNEYIDYRLGYGPAILGYADERVDEAARQGLANGGVFALSTEPELSVAKRIVNMVPSVDMVRFSNSGTEAVMAALRLARAYTGKDSYIVVEGGYHGLFDAVLWYTEVEDWEDKSQAPPLLPYGEGVPKLVKKLIHPVPLNDAQASGRCAENTWGRYWRPPHRTDHGQLLRHHSNQCLYAGCPHDMCDEYGVVLIVDEVKTGFRVARGGVQDLMGIEADLSTFAKAIANGYPISAPGRQTRNHVQDRRRRCPWRHLHRSFPDHCCGRQDPRNLR